MCKEAQRGTWERLGDELISVLTPPLPPVAPPPPPTSTSSNIHPPHAPLLTTAPKVHPTNAMMTTAAASSRSIRSNPPSRLSRSPHPHCGRLAGRLLLPSFFDIFSPPLDAAKKGGRIRQHTPLGWQEEKRRCCCWRSRKTVTGGKKTATILENETVKRLLRFLLLQRLFSTVKELRRLCVQPFIPQSCGEMRRSAFAARSVFSPLLQAGTGDMLSCAIYRKEKKKNNNLSDFDMINS